jgi:transaldolase
MKVKKLLHNLGRSLRIVNINRDLLNTGTLKCFIDGLSITDLTSNPTIASDRTIAEYARDIWEVKPCFIK